MNLPSKISIITPTYNSEKTIARTLDSILIQKCATFASIASIECVIIDNQSKDQTEKIVREKLDGRIEYRFISEKDQGIADAFNKGVRNARGEIIGILNSDDEYAHEGVLSFVMNAFLDSTVDFVHGDMQFIDERYGDEIRRPLMCSLTYAMPYNHPTLFVRRHVYDRIGLFKMDYRYAMDFEFVCRMYKTPSTPTFQGIYLPHGPLVKMYSGGASYQYELRSIDELKRALKEHGFWNTQALWYQVTRKMRIRLKMILDIFNITYPIRLWRNLKWH